MSEDQERTPFEQVADRLEQYREASDEEKQYQLERAVRDCCAHMGKEEKENTLILVDIFFSGWARETIHAALRDDAIYPENVVGSESPMPKLLR